MDGTLIDSVGVWNKVDIELIKKLGCKEKLNENKVQQQRDNKLREFSKTQNPYIAYCQFLSTKYGSNLNGKETFQKRYAIAQNYLRNEIDYKENVPEFLKLLKEKNYTLIIVSTKGDKVMNEIAVVEDSKDFLKKIVQYRIIIM